MNQNDVRSFLLAINGLQGYVPPMLFQQVTANPACRILEGVANGELSFEVGSPKPNGSEIKPNGNGQAEGNQPRGEAGAT